MAIPALPAAAEDAADTLWYETYTLTLEYLSSLQEGKDYKNVGISDKNGQGVLFFNPNGSRENFLYLGDFDLSEVGTISFSVACDIYATFKYNTRVIFSKDAAGQEIVAEVLAVSGAGWSGNTVSNAYLDTDYNGPLYISFFSAGCSDGYRVQNLKFLKKTGNEPIGKVDADGQILCDGQLVHAVVAVRGARGSVHDDFSVDVQAVKIAHGQADDSGCGEVVLGQGRGAVKAVLIDRGVLGGGKRGAIET